LEDAEFNAIQREIWRKEDSEEEEETRGGAKVVT
jgi:hypothetical protein